MEIGFHQPAISGLGCFGIALAAWISCHGIELRKGRAQVFRDLCRLDARITHPG